MTPELIVEAARDVLGGFDLDPASTPFANELIQATRIFTKKDDGLKKNWRGRVFLNPPGGRLDRKTLKPVKSGGTSSQLVWWRKMVTELTEGHIDAGIFVGFNMEILQSSQAMSARVKRTENKFVPSCMDFSFCVPNRRIAFDVQRGRKKLKRVSGKSPTHGNVIIFVARETDGTRDRFASRFSKIGKVVTP